ncbi:cold shock domain-containing protein [Micromonospora sp. NPDC047074]|uniref:cold-shock protein n=1 Tax=Micromonospora sp. NPDC047074 TaxID=3154339 RepID=UPI00340903CB
MLTGRVVRFDEVRGYGFIAPDDGGEDVFVHANMLDGQKMRLAPGVPVEYEAVESDRGPKALTVRVIDGGDGAGATRIAAPEDAPRLPGRRVSEATDDEDGLCDVLSERDLRTEITELLLTGVPDLTGAQIVAIRRQLLALAGRHGWTEG